MDFEKRMFLQNLGTMDNSQIQWVIDKDHYSDWEKEKAQEELNKRSCCKEG